MLTNHNFQELYSHIEVEHIPRDKSNHASLFITSENRITTFHKPFKFLKFRTDYSNFMEVVKSNWDDSYSANPFLDFKRKIKQVKMALTL